MTTISKSVRWGKFLLTFLAVSVLFGIAFCRMDIDTDIVNFLPGDEAVISDALYIFKNHPIQGQLFIDVSHSGNDPDRLAAYADQVEKRLRESGYFKDVGTARFQTLLPDLATRVSENLPLMFSRRELDEAVSPLLEADAIRKRLEKIYRDLSNIEGIGQVKQIKKDPLGLKDMVMGRLAPLMPAKNALFHKGKLISADRKHALVIADQNFSGTDTRHSKKISALIAAVEEELKTEAVARGDRVALTPVGGYRAALDNETIVRKDVERAILFATVGIALLLVFAFPRPYMGLLALVPAIVGTISAFFVFSLLHRTISIMVLGFGGAVISITVDHGIAYLLFLDRPHETSGRSASREVWSIGLLAAMTTVGAFGILGFSGFPVFEQLGQFAAIGISVSFVFVHTIFPMIFPQMPPARDRVLPLQKIVNQLAHTGKKGAFAALGLFLLMLVFVKPDVDVSLSSINTVTRQTAAAEKLFADVWGQFYGRVYLLLKGSDVEELQGKGDILLEKLEMEILSGSVSGGFLPAMLFPGEKRGSKNIAAWKTFWDDKRVRSLKKNLEEISEKLGFASNAFDPFFHTIERKDVPVQGVRIPERYHGLMGIKAHSGNSGWIQVASFATGPKYRAEAFYEKYKSTAKIFDPMFFSDRLGTLLFSTFSKMLAIIVGSVAILLFLFFLDIQLTLFALIPVVFAFVCTLGSMRLMGHSIGIPELMLAVIIIGMGVDYSLFFVRSYQRYADFSHASFGLIRMAVFMAATSTMIGFGVLCAAEHTLLRGAGWVSLLGIGYSFAGAFVILPPLLRRRFSEAALSCGVHETLFNRVLSRYRNSEAYPRMFARFKMRIDPMFTELPVLLEKTGTIRSIVDIGCGYGVPATWLLERFPEATLYGIDPEPGRVRIASLATGRRGIICVDRAPNIPEVPGPVDAVFILDMIHYLDDKDLLLTLKRLHSILNPKGRLMIRAATPPSRRTTWARRIENLKAYLSRVQCRYRSPSEIESLIVKSRFAIIHSEPSGAKGDLFWFVAGTGRKETC